MRILGISAFYSDSAAALIEDGHIVAAAQEERFTRKRFDTGFPRNAAAFCLARGNVSLEDVDFVAFYDKPFLKFWRLLETHLALAPPGIRVLPRDGAGGVVQDAISENRTAQGVDGTRPGFRQPDPPAVR